MLDDVKIHVKIKLSALWAGVMFCFIYGDYFGLWKPGAMPDLVAGRTGFLGTQAGLLGASAMMAIPSVMVFLSLVLRPRLNRGLNVGLGMLYTLIMLLTMPGAWAFYIFLGVIEVVLTVLIVFYAWNWPRRTATTPPPG
jgi:hypothetical protein